MRPHRHSARIGAAGFSLIEVLVTLVLVSTGLLGFAKLQASSLSNTQTARVRSLVALQAYSLAGAMYANRQYWGSALAPSALTVSGGAVHDPAGVLSVERDCRGTSCTPTQMAAHDLQRWAAELQRQFPTHTAAVRCVPRVPQPSHCRIEVSWQERSVAINRSTLTGAMSSTQRFDLHVEP